MRLRAALTLVLLGAIALSGRSAPTGQQPPGNSAAARPAYDIVYVRAPRFGDTRGTNWPEVSNPGRLDPGADLMLLHPDGSEEVLVPGGRGAVTDPFLSFDAEWCYYAYFPDLSPEALNPQRWMLPRQGSDIYRINLRTRDVQRLTHQEFTPNTAAGKWHPQPVGGSEDRNSLGYGILNLGPVPVAGGRVAFVSNRNGFVPPKKLTNVTMQLYVMDEDGANVTAIAPMTLGSALHPTPLRDGRLLFSTYETQGLRDDRLWGVWAIQPDGRTWDPVVSAFRHPQALHFSTQLASGDIVVTDYYNGGNNGFGALYRVPMPSGSGPKFHGAAPADNPRLEETLVDGHKQQFWIPFSPRGIQSLTPFTHAADEAAPIGADGRRVGRFTHPSAAPGNDLLVVWTPGPANSQRRPTAEPYYDGGLYIIRGGRPARSPRDLVLVKNDPRYNEMWPRAVVPYRAIFGVAEPVELPWLTNDGSAHPDLPPGTPFGIVGSSSFYRRESFPGFSWSTAYDGLDLFNTSQNNANSNWLWQGADAGKYSNDEIYAVRILQLEPASHRSYGPNGGRTFFSHANERIRILGEIPLRKRDAAGRPLLDGDGNPDTSFQARLAADVPFTFQMLDRNGMVLTMAQTWHQLRPGEVRTDCGGCHSHSQKPTPFESTAAGRPGYRPVDLTKSVRLLTSRGGGDLDTKELPGGAYDVEFHRDIRPLLQRSCVSCHTKARPEPPGKLVLDDLELYDGLPGDYARLAFDQQARWGIPPVVRVGPRPEWRITNASRYVRMFQSRRSLLMWKLAGRRLDGWTNDAHPTERVPGDPATLPPGASANDADLDYTGTVMPPPGSGVPPLTRDEVLTFARWIDLGAPIDAPGAGRGVYGWFLDELRPTLTISSPRPNANAGALGEIRIGVADSYSGVDPASLSVVADVALGAHKAGTELARLGRFVGQGIFSIRLDPPVERVRRAQLRVSVRDLRGNLTRQVVRFSVTGATGSPTALSRR